MLPLEEILPLSTFLLYSKRSAESSSKKTTENRCHSNYSRNIFSYVIKVINKCHTSGKTRRAGEEERGEQ